MLSAAIRAVLSFTLEVEITRWERWQHESASSGSLALGRPQSVEVAGGSGLDAIRSAGVSCATLVIGGVPTPLLSVGVDVLFRPDVRQDRRWDNVSQQQ